MVKWYGVLFKIRFQNNSFTCSFLWKSVVMLWIANMTTDFHKMLVRPTSFLRMTQKKPEEISFQYSKTIIWFKKEVTHKNDELVKFHTYLYLHLFSQHKHTVNQHLYWTKLIRSSITTISWLQKTKTLKTFDMRLDFSWIKNKVFYSSRRHPL